MRKAVVDPGELITTFEQLGAWLRRHTPQEVSVSTASALSRLDTEGPLRVSELAEREAMTQPGVTILVNRLADAGHAERTADPTDRRATLVRITEAGRDVLRARHAARTALLRERFDQLTDADRAALLAAAPALERLLATVDPRTTANRKKSSR